MLHRKTPTAAPPSSGQTVRHEFLASVQTDPGCVREANEDCSRFTQPADPALLASKGVLLVVADGMGGHSAGEVASSLAVEVCCRTYYQTDAAVSAALSQAVAEANHQIYEAAQQDETFRGMGTTCTALVICDGMAFAAHVGDSRLYLVRDGKMYLLTEDHSAVMELVKRGIINHAEARQHPDKNVILRALGTGAHVEVATWDEPLPVRAGDQFLLCSDGLYDLVEDDEIRQAVVVAAHPQAACEALIALAKTRGGYDNITVGVLHIKPNGFVAKQTLRATREVEAAP